MKSSILSAAFGLVLIVAPGAAADPVRDAEYIVDKTMTTEQFDIAFAAMADLMLSSIQNELAKQGLSISDEGGKIVVEMMVGEMSARMVEEMRVPLVDVYVNELSPEALRAYKAFLQTEHGREVVAATPNLLAETNRVSELVGGGIATEAVELMLGDMQADNWPVGTPDRLKSELRSLFGVSAE